MGIASVGHNFVPDSNSTRTGLVLRINHWYEYFIRFPNFPKPNIPIIGSYSLICHYTSENFSIRINYFNCNELNKIWPLLACRTRGLVEKLWWLIACRVQTLGNTPPVLQALHLVQQCPSSGFIQGPHVNYSIDRPSCSRFE